MTALHRNGVPQEQPKRESMKVPCWFTIQSQSWSPARASVPQKQQLCFSLWWLFRNKLLSPSLLLFLCYSCSISPFLLPSIRFPHGESMNGSVVTRWGLLPLDRVLAPANLTGYSTGSQLPGCPFPLHSVHEAMCVKGTPWSFLKGSERGKHLGFHEFLFI